MTQTIHEKLSALLDGELPAEQLDGLLARLESDASGRATLARYGLIGEALRSPVHPGSIQIAERVGAGLEPLPVRGAAVPSRARPWGGWLVAASVAGVAVLAVAVLGSRGTRLEPTAVTAATGLVTSGAPAPRRSLGPVRMTNYLLYHSSHTTTPFRTSLTSHLVTGRAEKTGWGASAEDRGNEP